MNFENKKISFGFSKLSKKPSAFPQLPKAAKAIELIDCLEGSEIKVKNAVEIVEKGPLVIAIKGDANNLVGRIERESLKNKKVRTDKEDEDTRPDSELTIEELAARQLLKEARNRLLQEKDTTKVHTLPLADEKIGSTDGEEPSIEDYENVPISDYGLAMLRGMGWKEGMCVGKNQSNSVKPLSLELRPKGLGLGAQKIVNTDPKDHFDKNGKQLVLAKGAFAKLVAGPHAGKYCEVQGLDDESGRIIVKTSMTNEILTINELFVTPVTKEEYALGSRVINNSKYEQYKEQEKSHENSSNSKRENKNSRRSNTPEIKKEKNDSRYTEHQKYEKRSNRQHIKKERKDSSNDEQNSHEEERYSSEKSKVQSRNEKKSDSRNRSPERRYRDKKNACRKEKKRHSSRDSSSEDKYSRRKTSKNNKKYESSSEDSSSSEEERHQSKTKKNKKSIHSKRDKSSDSEYKSRKSKSKRKEHKSKSKKHSRSRHESSSDDSDSS